MTNRNHQHSVPRGVVTAALRSATPRALAVVARRTGDFHEAEDAVQEAALAASEQWASQGLPDNPTGWLVTVAVRRAIDADRSNTARRERERRAFALEPPAPNTAVAADASDTADEDDTLAVFLMCCHPLLTRSAQIPLTLRAVGGLTTREIARGLMLPEATVKQRISRAKATLRQARVGFALPDADELPSRVEAVLDVLGIIHTESHSATEGESITRPGLASEALRVGRELLRQTPVDAAWRGEVIGLVASMLLTNAREPARTDAYGALVPLSEQDRGRWRTDLIEQGDEMLREALVRFPLGAYQVRAAIAAVHSTAPTYQDTDWAEVVALYDLLRTLSPGPVTELARLVALAEVAGADEALRQMAGLQASAPAVRLAAVRAHLLARAGYDASAGYREAAAAATNLAERRWFEQRASQS